MTAFEFMQTAFFILAGAICLGLAVVVVYAVIVGIKNHVKQRRLDNAYRWKRYTGRR